MKKICMLSAFILLASFSAFAEDEVQIPEVKDAAAVQSKPAQETAGGPESFRLTLDIGFTTVGMKQANDSLSAGYDVTGFGAGFMGTLDLGFPLYPFLLLGPRVGYLYSLPATYKLHAKPGDIDPSLITETTMDAALIPVELGARLRFGLPGTSLSVSTAGYAGMCFAHVANNADVSNNLNKPDSYVQPFDGLGFCVEWTAAVELKLTKGVDFNVHGGYRLANVGSVTQSEKAAFTFDGGTTTTYVGNKGDKLRDSVGALVPFDYSGMNIGVGISLAL